MHFGTARSRTRVRRPWLTWAAVVALVTAFLGVLAAAPGRAPTVTRMLPAAWSEATVPVTVVGDSLTSGYRTPGDPWTLPAQELLDSDGIPMALTNASGPSSGYVAKGAGGNVFADYVRAGVTLATRLVIIFGSDNDKLDAAYAPAVAATLDLVRSIAPAALVVVVGPPGTIATPAADLTAINGTLQTVATSHGAIFVDALDWFAGGNAGYLGPDGEHPNEAGEDYLAARFVALLTSLRPGRANLTSRLL